MFFKLISANAQIFKFQLYKKNMFCLRKFPSIHADFASALSDTLSLAQQHFKEISLKTKGT